jgi:ATP-dependent DNA helicase RecG
VKKAKARRVTGVCFAQKLLVFVGDLVYNIGQQDAKGRSNLMTTQFLQNLIQEGEGFTVEFKECVNSLNNSVYETVCSFSNRYGGYILLGVKDNGEIIGVNPKAVSDIKKNFVNMLNNPQKVSPSLLLSLSEIECDGKTVLFVYVPVSSQVELCSGRIFDRNGEADIDVTNSVDLAANLFSRKSKMFSEREIFPYVTEKELRLDLMPRVRQLAISHVFNHPWEQMSDTEILKSAGLYEDDWRTGTKGFNLAGILLFGRDDVIRSCAPGYLTDCLLRKENLDRYDDRLTVGTNLIEAFDQIMDFIAKHTLDRFFLIDDQSVSIRNRISREIVSNLLVHREFSSAFMSKVIIEQGRIRTENWNRSHSFGRIDPQNYKPQSKNPILARFFVNIGRADELGSGVRNLYKYTKMYTGGAEPEMLEADIFETIVPLVSSEKQVAGQVSEEATMQVTAQATAQVAAQDERIAQILAFCEVPKTRDEMQEHIGIMHREHFRKNILKPLLVSGQLEMTIPEKPTDPNQRYITAQGLEI